MGFDKLEFTGVFTRVHRRRLKMYRLVYGVTYRDIGTCLGCDWSTVMKWERGVIRECSLLMLVPLQAFFNGEMDLRFEGIATQCYAAMVECMKSIIAERRMLQCHRSGVSPTEISELLAQLESSSGKRRRKKEEGHAGRIKTAF